MSQLIGKESQALNERSYDPVDYKPTIYRQFELAKWVAKNFDEKAFAGKADRLVMIDDIRKLYDFSSKFVHPTPMIFQTTQTNPYFTEADVVLSVKVAVLKTLDLCLSLYEQLSEDPMFYLCRFQDVVEAKLVNMPYFEKCNVVCFVDDNFKNIMNNYKSIVMKTTQGDLELVHIDSVSKGARKLLKIYNNLTAIKQNWLMILLSN